MGARKILKLLGRFFLGIFALLLALLLFPEIWFRTSVLKPVIPWGMKQAGYTFRADELRASASRLNLSTITFALAIKRSSLTSPDQSIAIEVLDLNVGVKWFQFPPKIHTIQKLKVESSQIKISAKESEPQKAPDKTAFVLPDLRFSEMIPSWINSARIRNIAIDLNQVLVPPLEARVKVWAAPAQNEFTLNVSEKKNQVSAKVLIPLHKNRSLDWINSRVHARLVDETGQVVTGDIKSRACAADTACIDGEVKLSGVSGGKSGGLKGTFDFKTEVRDDHAKLTVKAAFLKAHPFLPKLNTEKPCEIVVDVKDASRALADLECHFKAHLKLPPFPDVPDLQLPTRSDLSVKLHVALNDLNGKQSYRGNLDVDSTPVLRPLLRTAIHAKSDFNGRLDQGLDGLHHRSLLTAQVRVAKVGRAIRFLHETPWAVPAPLNNLKGSMVFDWESRWEDWKSEAPFKLTSRLHSPEQAFHTTTEGKLTFSKSGPRMKAFASAEVTLNNIRLSLPRLKATEIPQFFPASNIQSLEEQIKRRKLEGEVTSSNFEFGYLVRIHTPVGSPVRIDTNFLQSPLAFDLKAEVGSPNKMKADIQLHPLKFKVFRRAARLESFDVRMVSPDAPMQLSGRVSLKSGEYKVIAQLYGTSENTRVRLTSQPAVAEDQLWAILLFGEPMDTLDIEQQDSAKSTERALSRGGFGLLSLYLFASTPIERVDYDPTTQRVSVRFRLAEGTSLEVGKSAEETGSLGVTKRLGKGWRINAGVKTSSSAGDDERSSAGATLEWSKRY